MSAGVTIGLLNPKSPENVGMVMRAAGCYGTDQVFFTGERFPRARKFHTDTHQVLPTIPLLPVSDLVAHTPTGAEIVAVELIEGAIPLMAFKHPAQAYYLFGPEDGSLNQAILDACHHVVYIPTNGCMNLAASVNVVLYDRMAKNQGTVVMDRPIAQNRDTNSRARLPKPAAKKN